MVSSVSSVRARVAFIGPLGERKESEACRGAWRLYDLATAGIGDAVHPKAVPVLESWSTQLGDVVFSDLLGEG